MARGGRLRERVSVARPTESKDSFGGITPSYGAATTVFADVLPGAGDEKFSAPGVYADTHARVLVRLGLDVTPKDRLTWRGVDYEVLAVTPNRTRTLLEIKIKAAAVLP